MNKKIISYSLFGDDSLYLDGMIENVLLRPQIYPDWRIRIYIAEDCPAIPVLNTMDCELVLMPPFIGIDRQDKNWTWKIEHTAMFWRYFVIDELELGDCVILRDADSRLSHREANVVNHWLTTSYAVCRIAENEAHFRNGFMMTGMAGFKGGFLTGIRESIEEWVEFYKTLNHPWIFVDLEYNTNILAPIISSQTIGYGFGHPNPLPPLKDGESFIGEVIDGYKRGTEYRLS